jgi:hypothetical protein
MPTRRQVPYFRHLKVAIVTTCAAQPERFQSLREGNRLADQLRG